MNFGRVEGGVPDSRSGLIIGEFARKRATARGHCVSSAVGHYRPVRRNKKKDGLPGFDPEIRVWR
jgi:hypothetical protein